MYLAYCDILILPQYVELSKEESKMSEPQIDRDTYRKIKKMSREELNAFLIRYASNLTKGSTVDLREMESEIRQIKGIGDKRVEQSMTVFERYLGVRK